MSEQYYWEIFGFNPTCNYIGTTMFAVLIPWLSFPHGGSLTTVHPTVASIRGKNAKYSHVFIRKGFGFTPPGGCVTVLIRSFQ